MAALACIVSNGVSSRASAARPRAPAAPQPKVAAKKGDGQTPKSKSKTSAKSSVDSGAEQVVVFSKVGL